MKVNLGCGSFPLEGWENYDLYVSGENIHHGDATGLNFRGLDEVAMFHLLEHLALREVLPLLNRVRTWLKPGGRLTVEVPDLKLLFRWAIYGQVHGWETGVYGSQDHPGEFHKCGFFDESLTQVLKEAGFRDIHTRVFRSEHPARPGFPCLEAVCYVEGGDPSTRRHGERVGEAEQPVTNAAA